MNIKILYEDENLLAVDKPSGLMVHSDGRSEEKTLVDWVLEKYPEIAEVGEPQLIQGKSIKRPGIVHRLDRETSGVILIAKNINSFEFLKKQFQERKVQKVYRCFVRNKFGEEYYKKQAINQGLHKIDLSIGRDPSDFRRWSAGEGAKGELREAVTFFRILKQTENKESEDNFAYLEVEPKTGRTHQIRVHMKALKHPVVGDKLYGPKKEGALGLSRLALHSLSISLELMSGPSIKIESELPPEFLEAESLL